MASFRCAKCGHHRAETGELRAAGGFWSKVFDVQGRRFSTLTCTRCRYTELYAGSTSVAGNVFDFVTQ